MQTLDRKLIRDGLRLWAQSLAIALVLAAGVALLVLSFGARFSLFETRATYYERNRFADVFASATRVPDSLHAAIIDIPGVLQAETRISDFAVLDLGPGAKPAMARIISLPPSGEPAVNLPALKAGRFPDPLRAGEIAVNETFAEANGFQPGDSFRALLNGRRQSLTITGTVLSPEFIYTLGPGALVPDDAGFGVIWMSRDAAAAALDLDGAFNDVVLRLAHGASGPAVIKALDLLLEPYGGTGAYDRDGQISHQFLDNELVQLEATSVILPPIFLVVSAFLVNMVLARLIALERPHIGLMKAVGYSDRAVAWHYLKLAIGIGALGIGLGWVLGWWGGRGMATLFSEYYHFPFLLHFTRAEPFVISGLAGLAAVILGALRAVRSALALQPAVAMAPPLPARYSKSILDRLGKALRLPQTWTMILRGIRRWPGRSLVTTLGVATSIATLIGSLFTFDSMEVLIGQSLYQSNRQDATITLTRSHTLGIMDEIGNLPGVLRAEGAESIPVRLRNGHLEKLMSMDARRPGAELARILDRDGRAADPPESGLMLSESLAARLDLEPGDAVTVEMLDGPRETFEIPLTGLVQQYYGDGAYIDRDALARLLRRGPQVNAAHLRIDTGEISALYETIKNSPGLAGLTLWTDIRQSFRETLAESIGAAIAIYSVFGGLIAVGVVYNAARIQLSERAHELASLRVLGFTRAEVSTVLLGELGLLTLAGIPIGCIGGYYFASLFARAFSSELITLPMVVDSATYGYAILIVVIATLVSSFLVRRRIDRLDLVAVLKTRE